MHNVSPPISKETTNTSSHAIQVLGFGKHVWHHTLAAIASPTQPAHFNTLPRASIRILAPAIHTPQKTVDQNAHTPLFTHQNVSVQPEAQQHSVQQGCISTIERSTQLQAPVCALHERQPAAGTFACSVEFSALCNCMHALTSGCNSRVTLLQVATSAALQGQQQQQHQQTRQVTLTISTFSLALLTRHTTSASQATDCHLHALAYPPPQAAASGLQQALSSRDECSCC